jgi:hypothetical protein
MKTAIDDALERLRGTGPEVEDTGPNHGPMAAEALVSLGCDAMVPHWVDQYRRQLSPMPEATRPLTVETWPAALGVQGRVGDWMAFFCRQLAEAPWPAVLAEWVQRLIPGVMAAGTHGLIRTAHAVRALDDAETPLRLEELAAALAYWAAYYQALPSVPRLVGSLPIDQALDHVPRLGRDYDPRVTPRDFVRLLDTHPGFPAAVDALAAPEALTTALGALTEAGARLYLVHASRYPLIFIHAVTGPATLRSLLPHVPPALWRTMFAYVWQATAAWAAAFGGDATIAPWPDAPVPASQGEIVARALDTGDHHAIKFVAACLQEHHIHPRPVYLQAALDWSTRLLAARPRSSAERVAAGLAIRWDPVEKQLIDLGGPEVPGAPQRAAVSPHAASTGVVATERTRTGDSGFVAGERRRQ